jgi:hypothetical protein
MRLTNTLEELKLKIEWNALKPLSLLLLVATIAACSTSSEKSESDKKPALAEVTAKTTNVQSNDLKGDTFSFPPPQDKGYPVRYRVRDGKITYQYKGIQNGVEEVYFTDYGMTEIKFTNTVRENPFKDEEEKISMITLMRDSFLYVVDRTTMNARRIDNRLLFEIAERSATLDLDDAARITYRRNQGEMRGIDTVSGVPCEKWFMPHQQQQEWRWNGMMIQTLVDLNRNYIKLTAVEIDTLSPLPDGIFELPKDVNVMEGASMKEWIEDLSKPIQKRQYFNMPEDKK